MATPKEDHALELAASTPPKPAHPSHWKPGQSGNPRGRPNEAERLGLERFIRERVDWDQWARACVDLAFGPASMTARPQDRIAALKLLAERGFGKARATVELLAKVDASSVIDVDTLDDDATDLLERTLMGIIDAKIEDVPADLVGEHAARVAMALGEGDK